jgi:hypothetical protein
LLDRIGRVVGCSEHPELIIRENELKASRVRSEELIEAAVLRRQIVTVLAMDNHDVVDPQPANAVHQQRRIAARGKPDFVPIREVIDRGDLSRHDDGVGIGMFAYPHSCIRIGLRSVERRARIDVRTGDPHLLRQTDRDEQCRDTPNCEPSGRAQPRRDFGK